MARGYNIIKHILSLSLVCWCIMSELFKRPSESSAIMYNSRAARLVGWGDNIPSHIIDSYPGLGASPDSPEFFQAVLQVQRLLFGNESSQVDGKLGRGTWAAMLGAFAGVADHESFWVLNDQRVKVEAPNEVNFVNFDQPGGLDLHRYGNFSPRRSRPKLIVIHWGGLDPHHCYKVFSSPTRKVSSHAGIGLDKSGNPTVYQYLDLEHKSWHAGWANDCSVGIDICQQPTLRWKSHYRNKGYDIKEIENTTGRGFKTVLSLDPRIARATRAAVYSLADILEIPIQFPKDHQVQDKDFILNEFTGIVGHHHLSANKWDIAPWWDALFTYAS